MKKTETPRTCDIALFHSTDCGELHYVRELISLIIRNLEFPHKPVMMHQSWPAAAAILIMCSFINKLKNRYVTNHIPKSPMHR